MLGGAELDGPMARNGSQLLATWPRLILSFAQCGLHLLQVTFEFCVELESLPLSKMPTVSVDREDLFERLEKKYCELVILLVSPRTDHCCQRLKSSTSYALTSESNSMAMCVIHQVTSRSSNSNRKCRIRKRSKRP